VLGIIGLLLAILGFFCTGDLIFSFFQNRSNKSYLIETLEKGTQPKIDVLDDELFPRPIVVNLLKNIFQPGRKQSYYHTICGEHGIGKTTLVRIAAREVGCGVIYVDVPSVVKDFGEAFGKAISFAFEERVSFTKQLTRKSSNIDSEFISSLHFYNIKHFLTLISFLIDESNIPMWVRALKAFKHAAEAYKAKHNRPAVIIYDNVSRLAYEEPEILDTLQDDAKDNADSRTYIAVFVSSEDFVLRRMQCKCRHYFCSLRK
jgi:Cdc6-like AAA superfamily ATPase